MVIDKIKMEKTLKTALLSDMERSIFKKCYIEAENWY